MKLEKAEEEVMILVVNLVASIFSPSVDNWT